MNKYFGLNRLFLYLAGKLLYAWVRTQVWPQDLATLGIDAARPVVYVMHRRFLSNMLVLAHETRTLGLPPARQPLLAGRLREAVSFFFLTRREPLLSAKPAPHSALLRRLVGHARTHDDFDVQIVPVSILWGRAPEKANSIWKLLFSDGWAARGELKQFFTVLLHGRQTLLRFSPPLSLRQMVAGGLDQERCLRKIARVLRVHFRRQREIAIGPDLSHRRNLVGKLLEAPGIRAAIDAQAAAGGGGAAALQKARAQARAYALEIAADYSYPVTLVLYRFLTWLWTRLYDGVEVANFDTVSAVATDHEIVYVPCHRSHIDYLLLSYIVFSRGLMVPHIAAGENLNLPLLGGLLRRGGAFFLRRSFKGNRVYAAVFNEYLHMMIRKGYSIEYFVEGGRSRTGRQLASRAGMLAMTVNSYLRDPSRPIVFVPVYIGYEKIFEGRTYIGELTGQPKKRESLLDLALTVRELRKEFGKVQVNFGEPIRLADVLSAEDPEWRNSTLEEDAGRPRWLSTAIEHLMWRIAEGLNSAAVANPASLLGLSLLATPRLAMDEKQLVRQLDAYRQLALSAPYAARSRVTPLDGAAIVAYCEKLRLVGRQAHPLGDILHFSTEEAVLATYTRNNILHLYALPALVACLYARNAALTRTQLLRVAGTIYPFLRAELFLYWQTDQLEIAVDRCVDALAELGWLERRDGGGDQAFTAPPFNSEAYAQMALLGQALRPTLIRYFITLGLLTQQGSGVMTPATLEGLCRLLAQRLTLLREFNAPEFFDKAIFHAFIATLCANGQAELRPDGKLHFGARLASDASEARFVLPPDVRHTIFSMTRLNDADGTAFHAGVG